MRRPLSAAALLVLLAALPVQAQDCGHLTQHFQICDAGTPYAAARWESGGDTDTLILDGVEYTAFEDYLNRDMALTIAQERDAVLEMWADTIVTHHHTDRFRAGKMRVVRSIDTRDYAGNGPQLEATMIGEAEGQRVMMRVVMAGKPVTAATRRALDTLSKTYAGLISPVRKGN